MYTLGPFAMTPGTPVGPLAIGRDVGSVQLHNDSPYRVYLAMQEIAPTATDSLQKQYAAVATPNAHPVVRLQPRAGSRAEQAPNAISDFKGTLWLMPTDPQAQLARTGGASTLAEVHLDVYAPWEEAPQAWANPRQVDITSQPRVIAVSMGVPALIARNVTVPAAGSDIALRTDALPAPFNVANVGQCNLYVYWFHMWIQSTGASVNADLTLFADIVNGGGTVITSAIIHNAFVFSTNSSSPVDRIDFYPAAAKVAPVSWNSGVGAAANLKWRLHVNTAAGGGIIGWDIGINADLANGVSPGTHGNFTPATGLY